MGFSVGKNQQKLFVDHFMTQVLNVALTLVDRGTDRPSPGETIHSVGLGVIEEIRKMSLIQSPVETGEPK